MMKKALRRIAVALAAVAAVGAVAGTPTQVSAAAHHHSTGTSNVSHVHYRGLDTGWPI